MSYTEEPLTKKTAGAVAREWIGDRIKKPIRQYARSEMRWLMDQLAVLCIEESLRLGEGVDGLCVRLDKAYDILHSAWYAAAPDFATRSLNPEEEALPQDEKEKIDAARHRLWVRHDLKRAFSEGTRSEHYPSIDKKSLISAIADYLAMPYLRHPVLDWIFLDMSISYEISRYGELLKEHWLPGKRDEILGIHARYMKAQGNLSEIIKIDWNETLEHWITRFWWALGFPVAAIWASFHWGQTTLGGWLLGIYGLVAIIFILREALQFCLSIFRKLSGKVEPRVKLFMLWDDMYEVWKRLAGPIVNPALVRDAMAHSTSKGAVWDNAAWSIIDRVIAIDAAVWVTLEN